MRTVAKLMILSATLSACGLVGPGVAGCSFGGARLAFQGHTTLGQARLQAGPEVQSNQPGVLVVTADPVPLPQHVADFSASPSDPPTARQYCFQPDGTNMYVQGVLPSGWRPPDDL